MENNDGITEIDKALRSLSEALKIENPREALTSIFFEDKIYGKGLLWGGRGYTKQLVLVSDDDRIFSSETIDLASDKHYAINNIRVLDDKELGPTVTKSNLKTVGRLKGLIVDGSISVNEYLFFDSHTDRLGLGTDEPNAAFSIAEDGIEIVIGTKDYTNGFIGTHAHHDFNIVTDGLKRLTVEAGGNIRLGNSNQAPIKVSINGKLSIGVENPDPNVDLHVKGGVRFNNKLQISGTKPPEAGAYSQGDIVWNSNPIQRGYIGWVCTKAGNPGIWCAFGDIH